MTEIAMTMKKTALTAALVSLFVPSFFAIGYFVFTSDPGYARALFLAARAFLIAFPLMWVLVIDRKTLPFPRMKGNGMTIGFLTGLTITVTGLVLYYTVFDDLLVPAGVQEKAALLGFSGSSYWFYGLLIIVANSSLEEYYWRWFNFTKLKELVSLRAAMLVSALGFTLHHLIVLTVYFGLLYALLLGACVFVGGVIFTGLYTKYDCIWSPWICHAVIDAGIMVVGYSMIFS